MRPILDALKEAKDAVFVSSFLQVITEPRDIESPWLEEYRRSGAGDLAFLYWRSAVYRFHSPDRRQRCSLGNEESTFKGVLREARPPIPPGRAAPVPGRAQRGAPRVPFGDRAPACRGVRESV